MRRIRNFVIDLFDGILAAVLYGGQGGLTYTTHGLEAQNQAKMRRWAEGSSDPLPGPEDDQQPADLDARIRDFRTKRSNLEG